MEKKDFRQAASYSKLVLPASAHRGWAPGKPGNFLFEMPRGCEHSGCTFLFPAKMTRGAGIGDVILIVADSWEFRLHDPDDRSVAAVMSLDGFLDELAASHRAGFMGDPLDGSLIAAAENASRVFLGNRAKDGSKAPAGNDDPDQRQKALAYHEQFPDLTADEVGRLVGLPASDVEAFWHPERDQGGLPAEPDSLDLIAARLSQLNEELVSTRGFLIEALGTSPAKDASEELRRIRSCLAIIATVLVEEQDPEYRPSRESYGSLKNALSAALK